MNSEKLKAYFWRGLFYVMGLVSVTMGMTFYARTGLGVSCIMALPFCFANATGLPFPRLVFVAYASFVVLECILKGKDRKWSDIFQFGLCFVISVFMGWFDKLVTMQPTALWMRLVVLMLGIVMISLGMSLMMNMHLIVNPADGLVQAIGKVIHKGDGLAKNIEDICCVTIAVAVDWISQRRIVSVGLGTLIGMICVGRVVALCNFLFIKQLKHLAGLDQTASKNEPRTGGMSINE